MKRPLLYLALFVATVINAAQAQDGLAYVAIEPCRVADTRKSSEGFIKANTVRNFRVAGTSGELAVQGGASNCPNPKPGQDPAAVAVYILAVPNESTTGKGVLSVYPSHQAPPPVGSGSTVNFARDQSIGNTTIATLCTSDCPDGGELAIMARKTDEDVVVDVQGYFYPAGTSIVASSSSTEALSLRTTGEGPITVLSVTIDVPGPGNINLHANTWLYSNRQSLQPPVVITDCAIKVPSENVTEMYPAVPEHRVEPSLARWRYNTTSDDNKIWEATLNSMGVQTVDSAGTYTYVFVCAAQLVVSRGAVMTAEFFPSS